MTVAIAFNSQEGVVLATDSTTTVGTPGRPVDCAQKILEIGPRRPDFEPGECFSGAIATAGVGTCGTVSWRNVVNDFYRWRIAPDQSITGIGPLFLSFVQERWAQLQQAGEVNAADPIPDTSFLLAAISRGQSEVECAYVALKSAAATPVLKGNMYTASGYDIISRIVLGYDISMKEPIVNAGISEADFNGIAANFVAVPPGFAPIREVIDYVYFLASSAVRLLRYRGAPPIIGGPIEVAVITSDRGFRWVLHKPLHDAIDRPRVMQ